MKKNICHDNFFEHANNNLANDCFTSISIITTFFMHIEFDYATNHIISKHPHPQYH